MEKPRNPQLGIRREDNVDGGIDLGRRVVQQVRPVGPLPGGIQRGLLQRRGSAHNAERFHTALGANPDMKNDYAKDVVLELLGWIDRIDLVPEHFRGYAGGDYDCLRYRGEAG